MVCRISWKRGVAALVFLAAAALCLILAMSSCQKSGGGAEAPVVTGFECDGALTYRDMEITGHLTRLNAGTLTLAFTEPASLKDMTMMWDGENISMKMYGLTFGVDPSEIPESALGKGIVDALDVALRGGGGGARVTEEGVKTEGDSVNGQFELLSDPESGSLLSLKVPSLNLKADFSNFAVKTS